MAEAKINVSVYLDAHTLEKVKRLAAADSRSISGYLELFIRNKTMGMGELPRGNAPAQIDIAEQIARHIERGPQAHVQLERSKAGAGRNSPVSRSTQPPPGARATLAKKSGKARRT
jgi:hypothetical protein